MPRVDGTKPVEPAAGQDLSAVKVVHVNDCAFYAERILAKASEQELPWSFYPRAVADYPLTGVKGRARYAAQGGAWLLGLARQAVSSDLFHIHSGGVTQHSRFVPKKYVLTLHGTDIRTLQYDERWRETILRGVRNAAAVMYTTPDLREHILPHRPDAEYLPVSIDLSKLPAPVPRPQGRPRVFFVSRWDDSKNAAGQLETARQLVQASGGTFDVYGLDWGPMAADAEKAGVHLVPRMSHRDYLDFVNASTAAVGQAAGILAASELEAMALGVPLYISLTPGFYPEGIPVGHEDVDSPAAMAKLIAADLADEETLRRRGAEGRKWIAEHHDPAAAVKRLREIYAAVSQ